jgi:hypothetical protein
MEIRRDEQKKEDIQKAHNYFNVRETGAFNISSSEKESGTKQSRLLCPPPGVCSEFPTADPTGQNPVLRIMSDLSSCPDILKRIILF